MDTVSSIRLRQFRNALGRLEEALLESENSIVRDACIQRFEFTFETAWKAIQADAALEGAECASPRDCLRTAFRLGVLASDEPDWFNMVEDRNRTSHTYDEEVAREIYVALSRYVALFAALRDTLEAREKQREAEKPKGGETEPQE
jgi:nucleotidyltransferase substrate binding protein (TIGR01987 family)